MLNEGDRIGEWVVQARLGHGGMATVYRCHHAMTERVVSAVKVFRVTDIGSDKWFRREVETLAGLRHPCIVRILHPGRDDARDLLFLAMDLVPGITLRQALARGPLSSAAARTLFHGVAEALAYAHALKIFHRDIKPSNIMIRPNGAPTVVDFGIATDPERVEMTSELGIGTPSYMAPELFHGQPVDLGLADVYGVGVLLHETLTGQRAFPAEDGISDAARAFRLLTRKQALVELDPGPHVDPGLRQIVRAASARDPAARPASMEALAELLGQGQDWVDPDASIYRSRPGRRVGPDSLVSFAEIPAPTPTTPSQPADADRSVRHWVLGGVISALVLGGIVGLGTWLWVVSLR